MPRRLLVILGLIVWLGCEAVEAAGREPTRESGLDPILPGEEAVGVEDRNGPDDGLIVISRKGMPPVQVRKPFGEIGRQAPVELPTFPADHFSKMLASDLDVWGLAVLDRPGDPSFESVARFTYPYKYPHCYVGVREGGEEPIVAWDGSVAYSETGDYMSFGFNGRRIPNQRAYDVYRGLLDGYLPAADYIYLDRQLGVGWEEMVVCEELAGTPHTYVRLRVRNYGAAARKVEFSLFPFVPYQTSQPRPLTAANLRLDGNYAYVGPGLKNVGFWLSQVGALRADHLAYDLELEPGGQWQLVVKFNGDHAKGGPRQPMADTVVPRSIFAALARQKEDWDQFFAGGMKLVTPETKLNDILRATAAHTFVNVDGDVVKGGAFNSYDIHYPIVTMRVVRYCVDWGYFAQARRYLEYLLRQPKNPVDGDASALFAERGTSLGNDAGYFLDTLARYHQHTGDDAFLIRNMAEIERCFAYILNKRRKSLQTEPEGSPNRGLISASSVCDFKMNTYCYSNDAMSWRGMVEMSKAMAQAAKRTKDERLSARAAEIAGQAEPYRRDILASIRQTTIRSTTPPFVPIYPNTRQPYPNLHANRLVNYANFRMYNHLLDAGILDEETTGWILDYRKTHGGELLGMIRWGDMVDNFLCEEAQCEKLRLDRCREVLLNFYAYISYDLAPGVWTGYEEFCLDPMQGQDPPGRSNLMHAWWPRWATRMTHGYEQTRPNQNIPELARMLVIQPERDQELLWLARAVPRHWLTEGQKTVVGDAPTRWGKIGYRIVSHVDSARKIVVEVKTSGTGWPRMNLRLRHPAHARLVEARLNGKPLEDFDPNTETVRLPAGLCGASEVETLWEQRP